VTHDAEAVAAPGAVRAALELDRVPWIRPLVAAYTRQDVSLAPLFAGHPGDPQAWRDAIIRVTRAGPRHPRPLAEAVVAQLDGRGAPVQALDAARLLARPETVAIVTGQQAGLFGGPLYTLLKAVTAIQRARQVSADHRVPVVPVFWVEGDDHDWQEVRSTTVLDGDGTVRTIALSDLEGAGQRPVSSLRLDDGIEAAIADLGAALAPTEFTPALLDDLGRCYGRGTGVADACARWIDRLLGSEGLVVVDASDPALKRLAADVFARELREPGLVTRLAREGGQRMRALGHEPQVDPDDAATGVFYLGDGARRPVRRRGDALIIGDERRAPSDLAAEAEASPERFSPNVLLRPLVQDRIFPTVAYVGGPSELAYQAQLREAYVAFGVAAPLLESRATATLLDAAAARFLDRSGLSFDALQAQDESALNTLLANALPAGVESALEALDRQVAERIADVRDGAVRVDPTLAGAADTTLTRIREVVRTLHGKIVQAAKRKDETLRRQFHRTRALAFPDGVPQERRLGVAFAVNRYGPTIGRRLIDALPADSGRHYLLVL
jgi:bacillithiol biosynthesis cysteine-adding enzyme BshC